MARDRPRQPFNFQH